MTWHEWGPRASKYYMFENMRASLLQVCNRCGATSVPATEMAEDGSSARHSAAHRTLLVSAGSRAHPAFVKDVRWVPCPGTCEETEQAVVAHQVMTS